MRYLQDIYRDLANDKNNGIPSKEDFLTKLSSFEILDEDFDSTKQNFPRGDGGMSKFYKYLIGQISYDQLKSN